MPNNIAYNQFPTQNKKLEGDAKWHRIQSVSHTLIFQVFFNITSVLEFVYSHFFTLYLICMWLLFIMPVIKLLFLTIVLPGDFVVVRRAFWRETEMAILVARTNLPVWDFQKLASLACICYIVASSSVETTSRSFVIVGNSFSDLLRIQSS